MLNLLSNPYILVFIGGGVGSLLRYVVGRFMALSGAIFPVAILLVNVVASGILGLVAGVVLSRSVSDEWRLLLGVGFCGGLSTFSSFSQDTLLLLQQGQLGTALVNIGLNVLFCLLASAGGFWLGRF